MTAATTTEPLIQLCEIPGFFGGEMVADYRFDHAVEALVALTGRSEEDPAIRLILGQLWEARGDLLEQACNFGRCIPDGVDSGIDEWDDDVLFEVTGHRRPAES